MFRDVSPGARGMFEMAAAPVNAFMEGQQNARRNALAQNDAARLAWEQQQAQAKQTQSEDDDAEWDAAYQAKDWGAMARLDPQATKMLWEYEQSKNPQSVKRDVRQVGGALVEVPPEGDPRLLYQAPESPRQGPEAPADQRLFQWYDGLPPDRKAAFLNMKRSSATPEAAAAIAGAKTTATESAKTQVAANADLPRVQGNASEMKKVLGQLKNSEGLRFITGSYALGPVVPGTPQADAYAIWEQIQGKAFLEAFNSLRGGGQITEKEGEKATAAITRLSNRKQSLGSFMLAIKDLEEVVASGEKRAAQKAGQTPASNNDPLGIR